MKILALDTSTNACSAALLVEEESIQKFQIAPRDHSNLILTMIDELLSEAQLSLSEFDAIAYGQGPGSFVGLRIAASVTQGIAFASDLPAVAVSSLAALAQGAEFKKTLAAFDARMGEVYWGAYCRNTHDMVEAISTEAVCRPEEVTYPVNLSHTGWVGIGTGWDTYDKELNKRLPEVVRQSEILYPEAKNIALLAAKSVQFGHIITAEEVQPVYIRNRVAQPNKYR